MLTNLFLTLQVNLRLGHIVDYKSRQLTRPSYSLRHSYRLKVNNHVLGLGGGLGGGLERGLQTGLGRGLAVELRSVKVKVRSQPGLVQYRLLFNSFELDSEVGRLVIPRINPRSKPVFGPELDKREVRNRKFLLSNLIVVEYVLRQPKLLSVMIPHFS